MNANETLNCSNAHIFDNTMKLNLPKDSVITNTYITTHEYTGSTLLNVEYTVTEEYQKANDLWYRHRILTILLVRGEGYGGLPIESCANTRKVD